jgi:hypothetical protein
MKIDRFRDYFGALLRDSGNPEVTAVETWSVPGSDQLANELKIVGADGVTLYLRMVRTAGPDEGRSADEVVVKKTEPGVRLLEG